MRFNAIFVIPLLTLLSSVLGRFSDFNKFLHSGTSPGKAGCGVVLGTENSFEGEDVGFLPESVRICSGF